MKTKKVRPVLVEATDKNDIYNLLLRPKGNVLKCNTGAEYRRLLSLGWIPRELTLISLEDEEIEEGDWYCYLSYKGDYKLKQYNEEKHFNEDPCVTLANLKAKRVIARQSQISPEYISKFIEQYNNDTVEDLGVEYIRNDYFGKTCGQYIPKLTNGFVTIVEKESEKDKSDREIIDYVFSKEPINYTEEEVKHLLLKCQSEASYPETHYEPCNSDEDNEKIFLSEFNEWFEQNKKK